MKKIVNLNRKFDFNTFYRTFISSILFTSLLIALIIGIGIVDNCNKSAQSNPFLNTIYIDTDNYILCFRYLGFQGSIPYGLKGIFQNIVSSSKPLLIGILVIFAKIKDMILNIF